MSGCGLIAAEVPLNQYALSAHPCLGGEAEVF